MIGAERIGWGLAAGGLCAVIASEGQKMLPSLSVPLQVALLATACVIANKALLKVGALRTERQEQNIPLPAQRQGEEIPLKRSLPTRISMIAPALGYGLCNYFKTGDIHGGLPWYYTAMAASIMCFTYFNYQRSAFLEVVVKNVRGSVDRVNDGMMKLAMMEAKIAQEWADIAKMTVELSSLSPEDKARELEKVRQMQRKLTNDTEIMQARYETGLFTEQ